MNNTSLNHTATTFLNGGQLGRLIEAYDWSTTPLGPIEGWPQSLKTTTGIMLQSPLPMVVLWGHEGTMIYNDGYAALAGSHHPELLGCKVPEAWAEAAGFNRHVLEQCLAGKTLCYKGRSFVLHRNGMTGEVAMDLNCGPIIDETGKPAGVLAVVADATQRVVNERALNTLSHVGEINTDKASLQDVFEQTAAALAQNNKDFPFAIIYRVRKDGATAKPVAYAGAGETQTIFPQQINLKYPTDETALFCAAYQTSQLQAGAKQPTQKGLPKGHWDVEAEQFVYIPLGGSGTAHPCAVVVAAINPYRRFDDAFRQFCQLIGERVSFKIAHLPARVEAQTAISESRNKALEDLHALFNEAPFAVTVLMGPSLNIAFINQYNLDVWQRAKGEVLGKPLFELFPEMKAPAQPVHEAVYKTGRRCVAKELPVQIVNNSILETRWFDFIVDPLRNEQGQVIGQIATNIEVTEGVKARQKMEESENQFRIFSNNIQNLAWMADGNGWIYWYNQRWYHYTGTNLEEMQGWGWEKVHHPDHVSRVVAFVKEAWTKDDPWELTFPLRGADGVYRWFLTRAVPVKNEEGEVYRWIGTNTNINEQVQAQEAVRVSEGRFRNLVQDATVAIVVLSGPEMKVEIVNKAYAKLIGRTPEQLLNEPLFSIIPEAKDAYQPVLEKVRCTGEPVYLYNSPYTVVAGGQSIEGFLNVVYQPYRNAEGGIIGVMAIMQNVTASVLSGKALAESEERFRTLATSIPQIVWTMDKEGRMDYLNHRWEHYTGQPVAEGLTQSHLMVHPDDQRLMAAQWQRSLQSGKSWKHDYRLNNRLTGESRWFTGYTEPLRNEAGAIVRWVGTATDINEQKQFSKALETLVWERTKALQQSNDDLQQFAHVASHDLKEPVRKIKTFAGRLEEELGNGISDRSKLFLSKVHSAANRMFHMIEGVLAYSSINATAQALEVVNLSSVMADIETDLEVAMQQAGAVIRCSHLPTLEGAPVLLYQLFYNLVNNSLKFAKAGVPPEITLECSTATYKGQPAAQIIYSDNGIGFEQDFAEKIFETFTRLHSKDKYEGTGLGLALCKKIVERHSGAIEAAGVPEGGAVFTITLPLQQHNQSTI